MNIFEFKIDMPSDGDGMGIPRARMPQIHAKDYPEYFEYLQDKGIEFTQERVNARSLKPMQSEFSKQGVLKQLEKNRKQGGDNPKPVIASIDNYIVDGHHRWLAAKNTRGALNVYRANVKGRVLLDLTLKFPKVYFKDIYNEGYKLQLERDADMYVLHITDNDTGRRTEVRGKSGYESGNYDANDKLHQLLDKIGKASNISDLINGEVVGINPKHPDGASAKAHTKKAFNEDGRVVKGVNTTQDVGVNQTKIEAKKFGNTVDKDGKPPLLSKKYAKNTTPNKTYNLGLSENYTPMEIAIMEGGHSIDEENKIQRPRGDLFKSLMEFDMDNFDQFDEDFTGKPKKGSRPGSLKRKAAQYLGKGAGDSLSKSDLRRLQAKANKMKKSSTKAERQRGIQLAKQVSWANNFGVADKKKK